MSKTFVRVEGIEGAPMRDESILYVPARESYCRLNSAASAIWEALSVPSTEQDLATALCERFSGATMDTVLPDVKITLDQMVEMSIIQEGT